MEWWKTGVVYQIYPRSFQDSNGDGVGDLPGIIARLDYLAELGIDAVWLSPFYPSPMADFGYDISDFLDVDPIFGTLDDFDELTSTAHSLGLKVIIDIVPNHTSEEHPWFQESRASLENPRRDWYVWSDGEGDEPPNNWLSVFGGSAWEKDEMTGEWYLHSFLKEQPDLNLRNPEVEQAIFDVFRFWLDRDVDGFRIDVAHRIMKDPHLRDNPLAPEGHRTGFKDLADYDTQLHIHNLGHPDVHHFYRRLRRLLDSYPGDRFTVGEIHESDMTKWASYYGELDEMHMPFNFNLLYAPWTAADFSERIAAVESALPSGAWPNYVLGNHDEARIASRFGRPQARLAAMLLLTLRGTPTLYYGDELGLPEASIPSELSQDPWGKRVPGLSRDGCRTPMQWDATDNAGFSTYPPWLPVTDDFQHRNVAAMWDDPASILHLYRRLLSLRRAEPALTAGRLELLSEKPPEVLAYRRASEDQRLTVLLNFSSQPQTVEVDAGVLLLSTSPNRSPGSIDSSLVLDAHEGLVIR